MSDETLTIDVVSDVVCPWCYLGEKRSKRRSPRNRIRLQVRWRPCQLDPTIPESGCT